jgi:signal transduction histidine kinase
MGIVALAVHNDGPTIPVEDRAALFEPFSRAISVRKETWTKSFSR